MIIPKIKQYECLQYDPIESWTPEESTKVHYQLVVFVGPSNDDSSVMFYIDVISGKTGFAPRKSLVLEKYSWQLVVDLLTEKIRLCAANSWDETTDRLRGFMDWEYDS
jgi:hypothetical protein